MSDNYEYVKTNSSYTIQNLDVNSCLEWHWSKWLKLKEKYLNNWVSEIMYCDETFQLEWRTPFTPKQLIVYLILMFLKIIFDIVKTIWKIQPTKMSLVMLSHL